MAHPTLSVLRRGTAAVLVAALVSTAPFAVTAPAFARGAPESFADLAAQVTDAVVNISASTTVAENRSMQLPQLPPGSPFQEFFDDFFNN
ncbi:hypothetical protein WDZ92_45670, partial [Nostoc sp. NIES-2111]